MKVQALRGVCIGVGRHLAPGEVVDLPDDSTLQFLRHIRAVEPVAAEPAAPEPVSDAGTETQAAENAPPKRKK